MERSVMQSPRAEERAKPAQRTVLIVEDETPLRAIIARNLIQYGYRLTMAHSVADAIAAMTTQMPDVVLLDVNLPDGTGWEVMRWLRAAHQRPAVIIYSAVPCSQKRVAEFRPDAVLTKPFPMDSLLHLIATVGLSPSSMSDESAASR